MNAFAERVKLFSLLAARPLRAGAKILLCGNSGPVADCQLIAAEWDGRFVLNRKRFAAVVLTTDTSKITSIGNDYALDTNFFRQVITLGM